MDKNSTSWTKEVKKDKNTDLKKIKRAFNEASN